MWPFTRKKSIPQPGFEALGEVLYAERREAFRAYCLAYNTDRKRFLSTWSEELGLMDGNPSVVELLFAFGLREEMLVDVDWRGEENAEELETFIGMRLGRPIVWERTSALRSSVPEEEQRDGQFIRHLFGAMDEDLGAIGWRLLFFDLSGDSYVLMPVQERAHAEVLARAPDHFRSAPML